MEFKFTSNLNNIFNALNKTISEVKDAKREAAQEIALEVQSTARLYCPISPTKQQYEKTLKKKKRSSQQFNPGGLTRSIEAEWSDKGANIFISSNSEGGDYAEFIHDDIYDLGIGSEAKNSKNGGKVGPRFIERAIDDNEDVIFQEIQKAIDAIIGN